MLTLLRRKPQTKMTNDELYVKLQEVNERQQALQHVLSGFAYLLKEFTFDITEIDSEGFKKRLNTISAAADGKQASAIRSAFDGNKDQLLQFINSEERYLTAKENELKDIIQLLHRAISEMANENHDFGKQLYERNLRIEEITRLNDLREIRESLKCEVEQIKQTIREKQRKDTSRMDSLNSEVSSLKTSLEKVKDAAMTDSLTGAYNRMAFDSHLFNQVERCHISFRPCSLLLVDIDDFKWINDSHGHRVGDRVLACFVRECRNLFRGSDIIARYGGDEFALLLPGLPVKDAVKRAHQLCKTLAQKKFVTDDENDDVKVQFSVSVGVSGIRRDDTPTSIIERADRALYEAKRRGKKQVIGEYQVKASS